MLKSKKIFKNQFSQCEKSYFWILN